MIISSPIWRGAAAGGGLGRGDAPDPIDGDGEPAAFVRAGGAATCAAAGERSAITFTVASGTGAAAIASAAVVPSSAAFTATPASPSIAPGVAVASLRLAGSLTF